MKNYKNMARGEKSGTAKINTKAVIKIRSHKKMPRHMAELLAGRYGITARYVYYLRSRKTWRHLD